jgi:hypothetical protein
MLSVEDIRQVVAALRVALATEAITWCNPKNLTKASLTRPINATRIALNNLVFVPEEATMSLVKIIVITVLIILSILFFGRFLF